MKRAWSHWNFEGQGLQTLNLELTRRLRQTRRAWLLWLLFPFGLHAFYLGEHRRAAAYLAATLVLIALLVSAPPMTGIAWGSAYALAALFDAFTIDRRVVAMNKKLRIALSFASGRSPPRGYQGRYTGGDNDLGDYLQAKEQEQAGHTTKRAAPLRTPGRSFAEQEALLREQLTRRGPKNPRA
ncbi:MAG: TM2 domain-containing protein [Gammaproteobacteria bacterium]|nr:TM2 domain-containing protein [Gammaproteobacteria bacterium]